MQRKGTRTRLATLVIAALSLTVLIATAAPAQAALGIEDFTGQVMRIDGSAETQAGAHPYEASTTLSLPNHLSGGLFNLPVPDGNVKDVSVDLPPGFLGNPSAAPKCNEADLQAMECPASSQVGVAETELTFQTGFGGVPFFSQIYNMEAPYGVAAQFGFVLVGVVVHLDARLRTEGDYGVTVDARGLSESDGVYGTTVRLWGVPKDPSHDELRGNCMSTEGATGQKCPSDAPRLAFLTNPSDCAAGPLPTTARVTFWQKPTETHTASFDHDVNGDPLAATGCEELEIDPSATIRPQLTAAGEPTGLDVEITVPQDGLTNPDGLAPPPVRDVVVTLPEGMAVNSASADGLVGCTPSQIALHSKTPASCPDASKIGTVTLDSPLVEHSLPGSVYLATQGTNPFSSLLALYIVVDDPQTGVEVKLPGRVTPDPATGQLVTRFSDNPQLPFESLRLQLKGGNRAALVNPARCGTHTSTYSVSSWAGQVVNGSSSFTIDRNCGRASQFTPGFEAGTANPVGGAFSPFTLRVTRDDGQLNVSRIEAALPAGLTAKLAGVPLCGEAGAAVGDCPSASQVGTTTVGTGAGSNPIFVPQPGKDPTAVYLAGPYQGAPYSLVVKVPAQAGPFDLGTVTVRNALHVDPVTAQVTAKSDPLPQILQGIPIAYRDVRVNVNRPDFVVNPTSCDPMSIEATLTAPGGAVAQRSARFQVAGCDRLAFKPKLSMRFFGAPPRRGGFPALKAVMTAPKGQANIGKAAVLLPGTELLEQNHIRTICTRDQWASDTCPNAAIYGKAKAWTPLLDKPLEGPVYLRANGGARELPDLVADLRGQIKIELVGYIDTVKRNGVPRMRTRFVNVPDAAVTRFVLQMQGGRKGLLANNTNLCKAKPRAGVQFDGQNGKVHDTNPLVAVSGCGKKGK